MRRSDVTFLEREVLPLLAEIRGISPQAAEVADRLAERMADVDDGKLPASFQFATWFHTRSGKRGGPGNDEDFDSWHVTLEVDGCEVPYIQGHWWEHGEHAGHVSLTLDQRFGIDTTAEELGRWAPFLANAMAVAAGRTSHGPNSYLRNPHGRSGGGDPPPLLGTPTAG